MTDHHEIAKLLYTNNHGTQSEIATKLGIKADQVKAWAAAGNWDNLKQVLSNTKQEQLRICYQQLANLNTAILDGLGYPTGEEAATQKKLASSIRYLETETSIGNTIMVAKEFTSWLLQQDEKLTKTVTTYLDSFIKQKLK